MSQNNKIQNFAMIDPHIHQWNPYHKPHAAYHLVKSLGKHPKLMDKLLRLIKPKPLLETIGQTDHILAPYLPQDYAKDLGEFKVESVIHVEANWHDHKGTGTVGETRWLKTLNFNAQDLKLAAIVAAADPRSKHFKQVLDMHQQESPLFKGIRKMASFHADKGIYRWCDQAHLYRDKKFLKGFEEIAKRRLSFDAWCYSTQLSDVLYLAQQFPETAIMLDHLGTPAGLFGPVGNTTGRTVDMRNVIFEDWKQNLSQLAQQPNVYTKISGLMMPVLGHRYHLNGKKASVSEIVRDCRPLIDHAIDSFGIERVLFASNYPMDKPSARLDDLIRAYIDIIEPYGTQALSRVFYQNAQKFYRLD